MLKILIIHLLLQIVAGNNNDLQSRPLSKTDLFASTTTCLIPTHLSAADSVTSPPTLLIAVVGQDSHQHLLSYLLNFVEHARYADKPRTALWVSVAASGYVNGSTQFWFNQVQRHFHPASTLTSNATYESALQHAVAQQSKSVLFLSPACLLFQNDSTVVQDLMLDENVDIVAPQLHSSSQTYSNYWCSTTTNGRYLPANDGCGKEAASDKVDRYTFDVKSVHSCFLIRNERAIEFQLQEARERSFGNTMGILTRANQPSTTVVGMKNRSYGTLLAPNDQMEHLHDRLQADINALADIVIPIYSSDLHKLLHFSHVVPVPLQGQSELLQFVQHVYVINLDRRPERLERIQMNAHALQIPFNRFAATDGHSLTFETLHEMNVTLLPAYTRYKNITFGEIGCFLSHYKIWQEVASQHNDNYTAVVLEDDVHFQPQFRQRLLLALQDARRLMLDWDLIYLGRRKLGSAARVEIPVAGCHGRLVKALYSWWTVGYVLTSSGARKLVNSKPLEKLLPVDELPGILSGTHPNQLWGELFLNKTLSVFATEPPLIRPLFYMLDEKYVSDTEASTYAI